MTRKIKFVDITGTVDSDYHPAPARTTIPEWYKNLNPHGGENGQPKHKRLTAKKCVPMLDAFSAGYILKTPVDVFVSIVADKYFFEWANPPEVEFQQGWQIGEHKGLTPKHGGIPKLPNPWGVITPPGYSCLYIPPVNRDDEVFRIFSGVVDTDVYHGAGSMPCLIVKDGWTGLIPAGTPLAQVIPFKRDAFEMCIGDDADVKAVNKQWHKLRSVFQNGYRKMWWSPKSYK